VYGRTLDDDILTVAASGWTWMRTFVLWDHETGSIWFGGAGEEGWDHLICVGGPLQDRRLDRHEFRRTLWRSWVLAQPESKIMRRRDF
jgi:hypothetical protein